MTLFRYKGNGLLYTITYTYGWGQYYKAHPYKHNTEIGYKQRSRRGQFRPDMTLDDFEVVAYA